VLPTIHDLCFGSGSWLELHHCQIGGPGSQFTRTVNSDMFRWKMSNLSQFGKLSAGCLAGPLVDSYNVFAFVV